MNGQLYPNHTLDPGESDVKISLATVVHLVVDLYYIWYS